ncbi:hypothetical protein K2Q16_00620 [Patescibacteria group bacterium]|nr:hypothetical protein [Patescibacteria group bacterium]
MFESGNAEGPPPAPLEVLQTRVAEVDNFPDFVKVIKQLGRIEAMDGENKIIITASGLLTSVDRFCRGVKWEGSYLAELGLLDKVTQLLAAYRENERAVAAAKSTKDPQNETVNKVNESLAAVFEETKSMVESLCQSDLGRLRAVLSDREQNKYTPIFNESAASRLRGVIPMLLEAASRKDPEKLALALRVITNTFNNVSISNRGMLRDDSDNLARLKNTLRIVSEKLSSLGAQFLSHQDIQELQRVGYEAKAAASACEEAALTVGRFSGRLQQR